MRWFMLPLLAVLVVAPTARAARVVQTFAARGSYQDVPLAGPVLAGDAVLTGRPGAGGAWHVVATDRAGTRRALFTSPPPRPPVTIHELELHASDRVVAVREKGYDADKYANFSWRFDRILAGPANAPFTPLAGCRPDITGCTEVPGGDDDAGALRLSVDGSRIAYTDDRVGDTVIVRDVRSGTMQTVAVPGLAIDTKEVGIAASTQTIRLAGHYLACEQRAHGQWILITDLTDGRVVRAIHLEPISVLEQPLTWDMQADGTLVVAQPHDLIAYPPADPGGRRIGGETLGSPRISQGRVLYRRLADGAPMLATLDGRRRLLAHSGGDVFPVGDIALDGVRAAWAQNRCGTVSVLRSDDVRAERAAPLAPRTDCGVPRIASVARLGDGARRLAVLITCRVACRGVLTVSQIGRRQVALPASPRPRVVLLTVPARRQRHPPLFVVAGLRLHRRPGTVTTTIQVKRHRKRTTVPTDVAAHASPARRVAAYPAMALSFSRMTSAVRVEITRGRAR